MKNKTPFAPCPFPPNLFFLPLLLLIQMKILSTLLIGVSAVLAFESTVPCILWSPKNYIQSVGTSDQLIVSQNEATSKIMSHLSSDICSAKLIAVVNQPEIHVNDWRHSTVDNTFKELKDYSSKASTRAQLEYIHEGVDIQEIAKRIASKCDSAISLLDPSNISAEDLREQSTPIVAIVSLPSPDEVNSVQSNVDDLFGHWMSVVEDRVQDDYAIIYTSSVSKPSSPVKRMNIKRRAPESPESPVKLPIFAKYQLFTPGVFMVLAVVFVFLFIGGTGIAWLVGIQTPVRFESKQKKN
ncbi:hypothetical protein BDB01DRAFT_265902 [Pilobolus umbonatus]|nr:hypothetical protein BDB01DRAFT_265902 [Pilobolus umbonatus]